MPPFDFTRRAFLGAVTGAGTGLLAPRSLAAPAISRAADRPPITHGLQSGDVTTEGGMVWARTDRPAQMLVEVSTTESFAEARALPPMDALPNSDYAAKLLVEGLPADQEIFYRIRFRDLADINVTGEPLVGRFRTAPTARRDVSFVWGGDVGGQGWGINLADGGMRTYAAMLDTRPDFFIHSGDTIYADGVMAPETSLPGGALWRNDMLVEAKTRVAESLDDFREAHRYNMQDAHVRSFAAAVPIFVQWDDHEVTNNWSPSKHLGPQYRETSIQLLAARARQAFRELYPMRENADEPGRIYRQIGYGPTLDVFMLDERSYRGPNGPNQQTTYGPDSYFIGPAQMAWLKRALQASRATWKVIASDMPLGLIVYDDAAHSQGSEAFAQGDGPPRGRELEIADLLRFIKAAGIRNTVWLTADVHYTAAHHYDPARAQFTDFLPFWEFVSGPLNAGTFGPNPLDDTFGPEVRFIKAPPPGQSNLAPSAGYQFFGHVRIDGRTAQMTVTLKDRGNAALWAVTLDPEPA